MSTTLTTQGLSKVYPNGTVAASEVNFAADRDDLVIILGPSGAGKSTLLRCMNRLLEPTSGKIFLNDEDITHVSGKRLRRVREHVGMIFQQFNLVHRLTVLENVLAGRLAHCSNPLTYGLSIMRLFPKHERDVAFDCLKKVKIEHLAYQRADTLSGGQQQRVAIARALAQEPLVFLADEPVASLDPASAEIVMETLQDIQENSRIPVIVNLHQIELARGYAKRIVGMAEGRLVFDDVASALTHDVVQQIYGVEVDPETGRPRTQRSAAAAEELVRESADDEIVEPAEPGQLEVAGLT